MSTKPTPSDLDEAPSVSPTNSPLDHSSSALDLTPNQGRLRELFGINEQHTLILSDARERVAVKGNRFSKMYRELDENQQLLAFYRVWQSTSSTPPYRIQKGWEKLSPRGELLDREMQFDEAGPDLRLQ